MDKVKVKESIENNLINFYLSWKNCDFIYYNYEFNLCSVTNKIKNNWPNFTFIYDNNCVNIGEFINAIQIDGEENKNASFLILNEENFKKNKSELHKAKFIPISKWIGMAAIKENSFEYNALKGLELIEVKNKVELKKWVSLVKQNVFKNKPFDFKIMDYIFEKEHYHFFIGKYRDQYVSTALTFKNSGVVGLYFISTIYDYRNMGFGTEIVKKAMNFHIKKRQTKFVLHATRRGFNLYSKLGFKSDKQFIILTQ